MAAAVRELLRKYPGNYEFGLWDFKRDLEKIYPHCKRNHADTVSRRLREFRNGEHFTIKCINPNKSRYKKVMIK